MAASDDASGRMRIDAWIDVLRSVFRDRIAEDMDFVTLATLGLDELRNCEDPAARLQECLQLVPCADEAQETLASRLYARLLASLADPENKLERRIHEHAIMSIWASLELFVKGLLAVWLREYAPARDVKEVRAVKVVPAKFEAMEEGERYRNLVDKLATDTRTGPGQLRLQQLLKLFDLDVSVETGEKHGLCELQEIRHAIAHRKGLADSKFLRACPWLVQDQDTPIELVTTKPHAYAALALVYVAKVAEKAKRTAQPSPEAEA